MAYQHKTAAGFFSAFRNRWIKGAYQKSLKRDGEFVSCFCLIGKVRELHPDDREEQDRIALRLHRAIAKLHPTIFARLMKGPGKDSAKSLVFEFNDCPTRRVDEIIAVAREARV